MATVSTNRKARRAMQQVFGTPELFEAILLSLSEKELLVVQRVHTHFRNTITQSALIQQRLFLAPAPPTTPPRLNPVLTPLFPPLFSLKRPKTTAMLNSLGRISSYQDWFLDPFYREVFLRPEASWRKMYPVQPPSKLTSVRIYPYDGCIPSRYSTMVATLGSEHKHIQDGGLTMATLWDLLAYMDTLQPLVTIFLHYRMLPLENGVEAWHVLTDPELDPLGLDDDTIGDQEDYRDIQTGSKPEIDNGITLYYNYELECGGLSRMKRGLRVDSAFTRAMEERPECLFEYEDLMAVMESHWPLTEEKKEELRVLKNRPTGKKAQKRANRMAQSNQGFHETNW
jgi:hypothetical protein